MNTAQKSSPRAPRALAKQRVQWDISEKHESAVSAGECAVMPALYAHSFSIR